MKLFIKKIFLLIALIVLSGSFLVVFDYYVIGNQYKYNYQTSIVDKVDRLESINESKIIIVGHSNVAFGINSKMIEDELGIPVVNLGLHGGLGNAFHEEIAKFNINHGDIIIVCHSSFSDNDEINDPSLAWITIEKNPKLWKLIRCKDYIPMMKSYIKYLKNDYFLWMTRQGNLDSGDSYSRTAFNKYGDIIYKPDEGQMNVNEFFKNTDKNKITVPQIGDLCINRLNQYNEYIENKGAKLLIAGYPIAYGQYATFNHQDFKNFKEKLQHRLNCSVISDYTDYFYPYSYFYDTALHLTEEGADIRTKQLISDIEGWMINK